MKRVFNLIIVDESGSMSVIHNEALMGMNETLQTIAKIQQMHPELEQRITLLTFDSSHMRFIYDNVIPSNTKTLTKKDYNPCGATPLYDAIGNGISRVNAQASNEDDVLVTIITDGEENCSNEYSLQMITTLIEKLKKNNWTFSLIGTDNLDVDSMASTMSIDNPMTFCQDTKGTIEMFATEQQARMDFCCSILADDKNRNKNYFRRDRKKNMK